jgi:hypothetical protein
VNLKELITSFGLTLTADIASSILAAIGCFAVLAWIARTPGRSPLERWSVPLIATLGLIYAVRVVGWTSDRESMVRWMAFWPSTLLPIVMGLFVEGLLRRHLPMWLKLWCSILTLTLIGMHMVPRFDISDDWKWFWPTSVVTTMALLARQMWVMRNAGLSRQERRLIAGIVIAVIVAIPMTATDAGLWIDTFKLRLGAISGLLFLRALVTPPGGDGLRDSISGTLRAAVRALLIASIVWLVLPSAEIVAFFVAFDLAFCFILLFEIFDRLRRRRPSEVDTQLMHWLAAAPRGDFDAWRRAIRHAPLVGDAVVLEEDSLGRYDRSAVVKALQKHGPVVSSRLLRSELERASGESLEGLEQVMDLLSVHDATHAGLISVEPLRIFATNLPYVGGRDTELQLRVILGTAPAG